MSAIDTAIINITAAIVANGNKDITANVLRPLLVELANAVQNTTGDPANLNTFSTKLVGAINEVRALALNASGPKVYTGSADPNVAPPPGYNVLDYYKRYLGVTLISCYQFNGTNWIEII